MSRVRFLENRGPAQGYAAAGPTASVGAAPSTLTSFAPVSLDFTGSTDPAGGGLTFLCTLDVKPAGSASTLVDATTSTPDFTPDKIGVYSGVLTVTDINGRTDTSRWFREVRSELTAALFVIDPVTLAEISTQLSLAAILGAATATGGIGTKTHTHTVNDVTTGLSDPTAEDPTFTPTSAGTYTWVYTVTDEAGQTAKATRTFTVGDTDRRYRTHFVDWEDAANAGALMGTTPTKDGIAIAFSYAGGSGGSTLTASAGVGLVAALAGGATSVGMDWSGVDLGSETLDATDDVVWYVAITSLPTSALAALNVGFLNSAGSDRVFVTVQYSGGWRVIARQRRATVQTETIKAVASLPGMIALRFEAGAVAEVRYSLDDYDVTGVFPEFSAMLPVYATRESNLFACFDLIATDTADAPAKSGSIGRLSVDQAATIRAQEIRRRRV